MNYYDLKDVVVHENRSKISSSLPDGNNFDWNQQYDAELEKFAESIIRKCATLAYGTSGTGDYKDTRKLAAKCITDYFRMK